MEKKSTGFCTVAKVSCCVIPCVAYEWAGEQNSLFSPDLGACTLTSIPFEKSKVLFSLEEPDEFSFINETEEPGSASETRCPSGPEKWGWIMFECGMENLTVKGESWMQQPHPLNGSTARRPLGPILSF